MKQRTLTGIALAVVSLVLLCLFHLPLVPQITTVCLGLGAVWEILEAYKVKSGLYKAACFAYALVLPWVPLAQSRPVMLGMLLGGLAWFTYLMRCIGKPAKAYMPGVSVFFAIGLYRGLTAYGDMENGAWLLCMTGVVCALTDIFAYLVGSRYGKHKLAYKVSPGKSVEGALGGLAASVVIAALAVGPVFGNVGTVAVYAAVASILGQWGDLSMSAVKRVAGVKDFGRIFPGHGGILDRCDSLMYPLAATWLLYGLMK